MKIDPDEWIKYITEMNEEKLLKYMKENQIVPVIPTISCGEFKILKWNELNEEAINKEYNNKDIEFIIQYRTESTYENDEYFDTSYLQTKAKNGTLFQVASNFNCHENPSIHTKFDSGDYLSMLMTDSTQGPSASAGAGAGAILRLMHHLYIKPINLLEDVKYYKTINGKMAGVNEDIKYDYSEQKVGIQCNVSANFDRRNYECVYYKDAPKIDQVFVSTICIHNKKRDEEYCKELLRMAYELTYLSAIHRDTEIMYLTLIGGGDFRNPLNLIIDALTNAHLKYSMKSKLRKVYLPLYDHRIDIELIKKIFNSKNISTSIHLID